MTVGLVLGRGVATAVLAVLPTAAGSGDVAFTFDDPRIAESSGLVALADGTFVTTNDSGDVGRVFVVSATGRTVRVAQWSDEAVDQESLAPSTHADRVWVGDTGDNAARRDDIVLREVGVGAANAGRVYRTIHAVYPDGAHDAETLMRAPDGRLLVVSKGFLGGTLYGLPRSLASGAGTAADPVTLEPLSSAGAMLAMATDGAFLPDGKHVLVRGYVSATLYAWPSLDRLGSMTLPGQRQGEGLAIASDGSLWLTSEGAHSKVLHIALSDKLAGLVAPSATATPSAEIRVHHGRDPGSPPSSSGFATDHWAWIGGGAVGVGLVGYLVYAWRGRGRAGRRTGEG
ncbi:hypothetical protein [Nocardioides sp.]|uniref:hypothetical protein n=1 Tax=Nocardioides sp. TaxID=35761 RepID=UPI00261564D5|nr:hypothetical protein [Nocardioides sp.]